MIRAEGKKTAERIDVTTLGRGNCLELSFRDGQLAGFTYEWTDLGVRHRVTSPIDVTNLCVMAGALEAASKHIHEWASRSTPLRRTEI